MWLSHGRLTCACPACSAMCVPVCPYENSSEFLVMRSFELRWRIHAWSIPTSMCSNPPPAPEWCATCEKRVTRLSRNEVWLARIAIGSEAEVFLFGCDWRGYDYTGRADRLPASDDA